MGRDKDKPTQYTSSSSMPTNQEKSIEYLRKRQYDYKANANLVLSQQNRSKTNEPTGEPEPLKVGELRTFGDLAQRTQAPIQKKKKKPVEKKKKKIEEEHRDILHSTEDMFDQRYHPKTEETSAASSTTPFVATPSTASVPPVSSGGFGTGLSGFGFGGKFKEILF